MKKFEQLTDAGKRTRLAKEVIEQLTAKKKKFTVKNNVYFSCDNSNIHTPTELQNIVSDINCECCCIGSMWLCDIINRDNFKISNNTDIIWKSDISKRLTFFNSDQLDLIECAFELNPIDDDSLLIDDCDYSYQSWNDYETYKEWFENNKSYISKEGMAAIKFGRRYKNIYNRLIAIMNNIITNKGTFKP